ncbi:uncharacterized protein LACBIDRAFT_327121 [Laccaria bicolor S238N-H82]|uniref:Predicted protein n=1 Tax=Laccaria bicolor (strain S238N-H82 / ATCC MYA-4686) TaxID=486041 RepID=B0DB86_LACBS|nr:uncharacterized protein LACBIDRAFT_327121 [Laccaria bicolor S238N-H82]EDR08153.1 predicted protein [Laccaria bicolor S238N-H82]|eukprot:XP_001881223.1 predicted protein [Laccaria bicolor S238N-H82]
MYHRAVFTTEKTSGVTMTRCCVKDFEETLHWTRPRVAGSEFKFKVSENAYQWPATHNPCRSFRAFGTRIRDQASDHTFRLTLPQLRNPGLSLHIAHFPDLHLSITPTYEASWCAVIRPGTNEVRLDVATAIPTFAHTPARPAQSGYLSKASIVVTVLPILPMCGQTPSFAFGTSIHPSLQTVASSIFPKQGWARQHKGRPSFPAYPEAGGISELSEPELATQLEKPVDVWLHGRVMIVFI